MSKPYIILDIPNLTLIQQEVLNVLPLPDLPVTVTFNYSPGSVFEKCPYLVEYLNSINIPPESINLATNITYPMRAGPIHIDSLARFTYSLNIPILNCENSTLNFFETDKESICMNHGSTERPQLYANFNIDDCTLTEKLVTTRPYLLDTSVIHQFDNTNGTERRYMLLCRILNSHIEANNIAKQMLGI